MTRKQYQKLALWSLKYTPFVTAVIMFIHVVLLLHGIRYSVEGVCGLSLLPLIPTYFLSKGLGFCRIHRELIFYTAGVNTCIWIQNFVGFGSILDIAHWIVFAIGILLFIRFFSHLKQFNENCKIKLYLN